MSSSTASSSPAGQQQPSQHTQAQMPPRQPQQTSPPPPPPPSIPPPLQMTLRHPTPTACASTMPPGQQTSRPKTPPIAPWEKSNDPPPPGAGTKRGRSPSNTTSGNNAGAVGQNRPAKQGRLDVGNTGQQGGAGGTTAGGTGAGGNPQTGQSRQFPALASQGAPSSSSQASSGTRALSVNPTTFAPALHLNSATLHAMADNHEKLMHRYRYLAEVTESMEQAFGVPPSSGR
ncbi:hypothetical protein DENSPDRAFT_885818 [Dentipellis sp. KUC8613]|nr:hypothetical protein DENSPDRAFT_885818 [Dentipellis sp. KUC8613]